MVNPHKCSNFYIRESMKLARGPISVYFDAQEQHFEEVLTNVVTKDAEKELIKNMIIIYNKFFKNIIVEKLFQTIDKTMTNLELIEDIGITCIQPDIRHLAVKFINTNIGIIKYIRSFTEEDLKNNNTDIDSGLKFLLELYDNLIKGMEDKVKQLKSKYPEFFSQNS